MSASSSVRTARSHTVWHGVAALLVLAIFSEATFAGAMLSGFEWARRAHMFNAVLVLLIAFGAGLAGLWTLRNAAQGLKFAWAMLGLGAVVLLQMIVGRSAAEGANLMWLHVPLGVALLGLALLSVVYARHLGQD